MSINRKSFEIKQKSEPCILECTNKNWNTQQVTTVNQILAIYKHTKKNKKNTFGYQSKPNISQYQSVVFRMLFRHGRLKKEKKKLQVIYFKECEMKVQFCWHHDNLYYYKIIVADSSKSYDHVFFYFFLFHNPPGHRRAAYVCRRKTKMRKTKMRKCGLILTKIQAFRLQNGNV